MAKQRANLAPSSQSSTESSASSSSSSSSTSSSLESNINVGGAAKARSPSITASAAPTHSTPPTSLPEESISDAASASDKQAMDAQLAAAPPRPASGAGEEAAMSRRSSRRISALANYSADDVSRVKRASLSSVNTIKQKVDGRSFSGQTLVNETTVAQASTANTPNQKLLDDSLKSLDMEWDINAVTDASNVTAKPAPKPKSRRKSLLQLGTEAVGDLASAISKKVLGKRRRDDTESGPSAGRRQSTRLSAILPSNSNDKTSGKKHKHHENDNDDDDNNNEDDDEPVQRPSKMARVTSSLSMHSLTSTFNLSSTKQPKLRERPVKRYQRQGLYVGQSAQDYDPDTKKPKKRKSTGRPTSSASESASASASASKLPIIPLPMFDYLERERHFVVPYGVFAPTWRERGTEKPKDWGKINKNRFVGEAKDEWRNVKLPTSLCACKEECGEDCWNVAMGVECDKTNCNVGPECGNRDFSELSIRMARAAKYDKKTLAYLYNAGVEVIKTNSRGFGVRACREFQPNEIITEYTGEIITQNEGYRRVKEEYAGKSDYYQMEFDQGMILDATRGSLARFVNHSCDPNCEMVKRTVAGQPRMALFAGDKGIMTGEELTYDYNFDPYSTTNVQACLCGAANCRLFLGPKPAGEKKPSSKKEQIDMAMNLKRTASGSSKRKASELYVDVHSMEVEVPKELIKKRKVPQMSKGWAYVDDDMERQRVEEAEKDRELKRLQRDGLIPDIQVSRPKYPSRSANAAAAAATAGRRVVEKVKTMASSSRGKVSASRPSSSKSSSSKTPSSKSAARFSNTTAVDEADEDEPKPHKPSMLSRVHGSLKRKGSEASEKRRSTLSTAASFRQSTINFQPRSVSGASGEGLLARTGSLTDDADDKASKRASYMSRASSRSKRNSTVRIVEEGE